MADSLTEAQGDIPVCILAGGLGTRLGEITAELPKPMVPVGDKPFLHLQMARFAELGFRRFVLAVSYRWEKIEAYFGDGSAFGWEIAYSVEPEPLGTGGAVRLARPLWGERAIVANGDTFLDEDWPAMLAAHRSANLPATMALVRCEDCSSFGKVTVREGRVTAFQEKRPDAGPGWVNGGVYVLEADALDAAPAEKRFSLETEVFPALAGRIAAWTCQTRHVDIGTPDRLAAFRADRRAAKDQAP